METDGAQLPSPEPDERTAAIAGLEGSLLKACATERVWPARVAAAICAGLDFVGENPAAARLLTERDGSDPPQFRQYRVLVGRLTGFVRATAPSGPQAMGSVDEALVAGMVGLIGDHIRLERLDRLKELRAEIVFLVLLPYVGFEEAQRWANWAEEQSRKG